MRMAAIILAGGEGRRIGGDKPLRLLAGRSLIERAIDLGRAFSPDIAISVGASDCLGQDGIPHLIDKKPDWGPLAGLAAGLEFAQERACDLLLTLPCDSPFLPSDLVARLSRALDSTCNAAIPSSRGRLQPACGLWRTSVAALVADFAASGRRSLHGFAETVGFSTVVWRDETRDSFFNINSPEQLAAAESMLKQASAHLPSG